MTTVAIATMPPTSLPAAMDVDPPQQSISQAAKTSQQSSNNTTSSNPPSVERASRPSMSSERPSSRRSSAEDKSPSESRPKITVKQEPTSPSLNASRRRPKNLDLSKGSSVSGGPRTSGVMTSREVGLACLSPGFSTQDPAMRERLQQSMAVREQQKNIIEARLQHSARHNEGPKDSPFGGQKTGGLSRKRGPSGLSITAPNAQQFQNERVIQSAPLNQSFTGLQRAGMPPARQIANQPTNLSNSSHIHQVPPPPQNVNRLPSIQHVLANERHPENRGEHGSSSNGYYGQSAQYNQRSSPNHHSHLPPPQSASGASRPREYRSAEEAVAELAGGRPELMPKVVHYSSQHERPSPPSPGHPTTNGYSSGSKHDGPGAPLTGGLRSARRRPRVEYERDNGSPPLGAAPDRTQRSWAERDEDARKKDEFLSLCSRAWDLFHS